MSKPIVLFSGGLDSTVLLWWMRKNVAEPKAISFDYGQRHKRELAQAIFIAHEYGFEHTIVDLRSINPLISTGSQSGRDPVPYGHYTASTMKQTIVPNRNSIMLSVAVAWAVSSGSKEVYYSAHAGDHVVYPDCRPEFVQAFDKAAQAQGGEDCPIRVQAPFVHISKTEIVKRGLELGVPFELTHTCYEGGIIACGQCGTCVERLEAFRENNTTDLIPYRGSDWLAYVAGFFDGEGCIVSRTNTGVIGRIISVILSQNWVKILEDIKEVWGGSLHKHRNKNTYNLSITSQPGAEKFLRDVLPYLRMRRREAEIALAILAIKGNDPKALVTRERYHELLKEAAQARRSEKG